MQKQYLVKYIKGGLPTLVTSIEDYKLGDKVVLEIDGAIFFGEVVKVTEGEQDETLPLIMRTASKEDEQKYVKNSKREREALNKAKEICARHTDEIKLLTADYSLNDSKLVFTFSSDNRIDFRNLVKDLATAFKTRIELKQIGVRDETKIMGGLGPCGKEVCCKQFLNYIPQTSIKMAKNQSLSLNPTKISGLCGRIMCCMSYENDNYVAVLNRMPKVNSLVKVDGREGKVIYNDILKEKVTVKFEDGDKSEIIEYDLDKVAREGK